MPKFPGEGTKKPRPVGPVTGLRGLDASPGPMMHVAPTSLRWLQYARLAVAVASIDNAVAVFVNGLAQLWGQGSIGHANLAITGQYLAHIAPHDLIDSIRQREWGLES